MIRRLKKYWLLLLSMLVMGFAFGFCSGCGGLGGQGLSININADNGSTITGTTININLDDGGTDMGGLFYRPSVDGGVAVGPTTQPAKVK